MINTLEKVTPVTQSKTLTDDQLEQLANNYISESDYWNSKEEYTNSLNLSEKDLNSFRFYLMIAINTDKRAKNEAKFLPIISNCLAFRAVCKTNNTHYVIFHPCTNKEYKYQLSYFDSIGAIMDEKSNTIKEALENYIHICNNYEIVEVIKND